MGQEEVLKVLQEADKPLSRTEIAHRCGYPPNKVSFLLNKLRRYGEVSFIEINRIKAKKHYGCYRRMMLFFVEE